MSPHELLGKSEGLLTRFRPHMYDQAAVCVWDSCK
jgi:hypothetical protein